MEEWIGKEVGLSMGKYTKINGTLLQITPVGVKMDVGVCGDRERWIEFYPWHRINSISNRTFADPSDLSDLE